MSATKELVVVGGRPLSGRLRLPGDKSISHRALLFAALASGASRVRRLADGDDVRSTREAIERLGVRVHELPEGGLVINGRGVDGLHEPHTVIDCGNSGTSMRLLLGLLAGRPFHSVLTGDDSLCRRPMARVAEPLRRMGAHVDGREGGKHAPLAVRGGGLQGIRHELPVASAQVKSALVLAGLQADGVTDVLEPAPSRDHTERMLTAFGAPVEAVDGGVQVRRGAPSPFELDVPGDPSSAAFFAVAACITPGSDVVLEEVCLNPSRVRYLDVLARMGADVEARVTGDRAGEPVGDIHVRASRLSGTVVEGDEVPAVQDEIPVLAVAAAFAEGLTEFRDAAELRVKESDRIATMEQELTELGVATESRADALVVRGGHPRTGLWRSHGDHRVALAGAIAGVALPGETKVRGWQAVSISYPGFVDDLAALGGAVGQ
ncbi:MAG TPA: 3-phosphoshikimate 1-carboxyvinyltransferase [Acidimicrobiia bacterium]|jgi:3-phosphoshikimate 1-carboxyvinyltransferase